MSNEEVACPNSIPTDQKLPGVRGSQSHSHRKDFLGGRIFPKTGQKEENMVYLSKKKGVGRTNRLSCS